jgi:hypothetical protein
MSEDRLTREAGAGSLLFADASPRYRDNNTEHWVVKLGFAFTARLLPLMMDHFLNMPANV